MKLSNLICLLLLTVICIPPAAIAQQQRSRRTRERGQRVDPGAASQTFQILGFTITTGGDDLRTDSGVRAHLTFQSDPSYDCTLHGNVAGGAANLTWDNNSTHVAQPCLLRKPMNLADLRQIRISLVLDSSGIGASPDNWNINRVLVTAYNPGSSDKACLFNVSGDPLARLTNDQPRVAISDFPNQCR